jgi:hypothetical protein
MLMTMPLRATIDEVKGLRREASILKRCFTVLTFGKRLLEKNMIGGWVDDTLDIWHLINVEITMLAEQITFAWLQNAGSIEHHTGTFLH